MLAGRLSHRIVAVSLTALLCWQVMHASSQELRNVAVAEETLRSYAIEVVMPSYPSRTKRHHVRGVAVVHLDVNEKGDVVGVEVLEAPHPLVSQTVTEAVRQWKFKPPTIRGKAVPIRGKLTFYYVVKKGKGTVENPKQFR